MEEHRIIVRLAEPDDIKFAKEITDEMEASAIARGSGISKRSPNPPALKCYQGKQ